MAARIGKASRDAINKTATLVSEYNALLNGSTTAHRPLKLGEIINLGDDIWRQISLDGVDHNAPLPVYQAYHRACEEIQMTKVLY